mgnify:CR=1 FL=1
MFAFKNDFLAASASEYEALRGWEGFRMSVTEKQKALEMALTQIEKQFGKGSIMKLGETSDAVIEVIPTGALSVDIALGVGGVPRGRIVELYGPESAGKTTVALHIAAEAQKGGGIAAYIDVEHALDPSYAQKLGVDIDNLLISQPDTGEQALEIAEALVRSGAVDIVVVDSVAALAPRAEIEGEMGDAHVGLQARLMSQALRKLTGAISKSRTTVIFINQIREKIGIMFGNPETTPGGRALKFYSSVRMEVRKTETLKQGSELIGMRVRCKIVKNKVAPPFKEGGAWYSYNENRIGQGRDNARDYLKQNPEIMKEIETKVLDKLGLKRGGSGSGADGKTKQTKKDSEAEPSAKASKKTTSAN